MYVSVQAHLTGRGGGEIAGQNKYIEYFKIVFIDYYFNRALNQLQQSISQFFERSG